MATYKPVLSIAQQLAPRNAPLRVIKSSSLYVSQPRVAVRKQKFTPSTRRFISTQDGMNVLSVREGMKHVRDYVSQGNGPMVVEMSTYRYHGHSMSDPGKIYRDREEVKAMRENNDPIKNVRQLLLGHTDATEDELNTIEKNIRAEVEAARDRALAGSTPSSTDDLVRNIYLDENGKDVPQSYIRLPDYEKSIRA